MHYTDMYYIHDIFYIVCMHASFKFTSSRAPLHIMWKLIVYHWWYAYTCQSFISPHINKRMNSSLHISICIYTSISLSECKHHCTLTHMDLCISLCNIPMYSITSDICIHDCGTWHHTYTPLQLCVSTLLLVIYVYITAPLSWQHTHTSTAMHFYTVTCDTCHLVGNTHLHFWRYVRCCCLTRRSLKILALWEDH